MRIKPNGIILLILMAELFSFILFDSDVLRAGLVSSILLGVTFFGLLAAFLKKNMRIRLKELQPFALLMIVVGVGGYGFLLAVLGGNNVYYIMADAYHWFIEFTLAVLLIIWLLKNETSEDAKDHIVNWSILSAIVGLGVVLLGTLHLLPNGGHVIGSLGLWRLELGRGFPEYLLIPVTAVLVGSLNNKKTKPLIAWLLLMLVLIFTFKRTLWGSYLVVVPFLLMSKKAIRVTLLLSVYLLIAGILVVVLFPGLVERAVFSMLDMVNYNPNYTTEDSLLERVQQISSAARYVQIKPWGYGLGAEFYTYWPGGNDWGTVHYIHNLYLFLLLQFGMPGFAFIVLGLLGTFWLFFRQLNIVPEWDWCLRTGIAGLMAILINGLTLLSIHSVFASLLVGLGYFGYFQGRASLSSESSSSGFSTHPTPGAVSG